MIVTPLSIPDVLLLTPNIFGDARGFFMETYRQDVLNEAAGQPVRFVQDNHSRSGCHVLRGLHYQLPPHAQGKLVRVTQGEVFDVAVDIRPGSPSFGQWVGAVLSEENQQQMWIPAGFAHGFLVLSESADFLYKTTEYYAPQAERALRWDDPAIGIAWPEGIAPLLNARDAAAPLLAEADLPKA